MAYFHSPRIITQGLILCLDPANAKSYPGSGTQINDLVSNNNLSFTNVTHSSANKGILNFNGTNAYAEMDSHFPTSTNQTISFWFKSNNFSAEQILMGRVFGTNNCITLRNNRIHKSRDNAYRTIRSDFQDDTWYFVTVISINNVNETKIYVNGEEEALETNSTSNRVSSTSLIGARNISSTIELFFNGSFGPLYIHNRMLTDQEVMQNFKATKSRFGL